MASSAPTPSAERRVIFRRFRPPMAINASLGIVQKLWNYCNILRDDGLSYGDYIEQLTYLLFLKIALERFYRELLQTLGREPGMLGVIFRKAQNRIQDPAKLRRLIVDLIDKEQWMT